MPENDIPRRYSEMLWRGFRSLLGRTGIDGQAIRRVALCALGAPPDVPAVPLPPVAPAGTRERPPLSITDLDQRAWTAMCWRQEHLRN
ncbi:MAG: hypothetical protein ACR2G7_00405 [Acidimicrobiales bacterium]